MLGQVIIQVLECSTFPSCLLAGLLASLLAVRITRYELALALARIGEPNLGIVF